VGHGPYSMTFTMPVSVLMGAIDEAIGVQFWFEETAYLSAASCRSKDVMKLTKHVRLDSLVNAAILVTCGLLVLTILQHRAVYTAWVAGQKGPESPFKIGESAEVLPGIDYGTSNIQLVLYVKSTCPYCTNSMAFYRLIDAEMQRLKSVSFIAVSSEPVDILRTYLDQNSLRVDRLVSMGHKALGTPTLVLVDNRGTIRGVWEGQQTAAGEGAIVEALRLN